MTVHTRKHAHQFLSIMYLNYALISTTCIYEPDIKTYYIDTPISILSM